MPLAEPGLPRPRSPTCVPKWRLPKMPLAEPGLPSPRSTNALPKWTLFEMRFPRPLLLRLTDLSLVPSAEAPTMVQAGRLDIGRAPPAPRDGERGTRLARFSRAAAAPRRCTIVRAPRAPPFGAAVGRRRPPLRAAHARRLRHPRPDRRSESRALGNTRSPLASSSRPAAAGAAGARPRPAHGPCHARPRPREAYRPPDADWDPQIRRRQWQARYERPPDVCSAPARPEQRGAHPHLPRTRAPTTATQVGPKWHHSSRRGLRRRRAERTSSGRFGAHARARQPLRRRRARAKPKPRRRAPGASCRRAPPGAWA